MQTFLPYPSFDESARVLDYRRLGKQRVEAMQILRTLRGESRGWRNHPVVVMWRGYEDALSAYMNACIVEWTRRGYRNTMPLADVPSTYEIPSWLGDEAFHREYRQRLLSKEPTWYAQFGWERHDNIKGGR